MLTMARGGLVVDWEGTSGAGQGEQMLDHGSLPPWHAPGHDKRWRFGPFMAAGGFIGGCIGGFIDGCQWWCAAQPPLVQVVSVWLVQWGFKIAILQSSCCVPGMFMQTMK